MRVLGRLSNFKQQQQQLKRRKEQISEEQKVHFHIDWSPLISFIE